MKKWSNLMKMNRKAMYTRPAGFEAIEGKSRKCPALWDQLVRL